MAISSYTGKGMFEGDPGDAEILFPYIARIKTAPDVYANTTLDCSSLFAAVNVIQSGIDNGEFGPDAWLVDITQGGL